MGIGFGGLTVDEAVAEELLRVVRPGAVEAAMVAMRSYNEIPRYTAEKREAEGWMNLTQAAAFLGIGSRTLRIAVEQGEIKAEHPVAAGPWVFSRSVLEAAASARLVERIRRRAPLPAIPAADQAALDFSAT